MAAFRRTVVCRISKGTSIRASADPISRPQWLIHASSLEFRGHAAVLSAGSSSKQNERAAAAAGVVVRMNSLFRGCCEDLRGDCSRDGEEKIGASPGRERVLAASRFKCQRQRASHTINRREATSSRRAEQLTVSGYKRPRAPGHRQTARALSVARSARNSAQKGSRLRFRLAEGEEYAMPVRAGR